jgi:hypothetical protein
MSKTRIYHVTVIQAAADAKPQERLVRAKSAAQALGFVSRKTITCDLASQDELVRLAAAGTAVEDATAEPEGGAQ